MIPISQLGFTKPKRKAMTPAQKMNAVLPFSKRPVCPEQDCGASMTLRTRKMDGEVFWGCSRFSRCSGSIPIDPKAFKSAYDALSDAARK